MQESSFLYCFYTHFLYCFYTSDTENSATFAQESIDHFAEIHTVFPDALILNPLRRMQMPYKQWHLFLYKNYFPIPLYSPAEENIARIIGKDVLLTYRYSICIARPFE